MAAVRLVAAAVGLVCTFTCGAVMTVAQSGSAFVSPTRSEPSAAPVSTYTAGVELVTLNVAATDKRNRRVSGLTAEEFQVLEDGVPQELSFFTASPLPLDVALLLDTSSSMLSKLVLVQQAAIGFIRALRRADRAAVIGFADRVSILQPFTGDLGRLTSAVRRLEALGDTALYTAVYVTLDQFARTAGTPGEVRRPAIVLVTDGEDNSSLIGFDQLLERARRAGVAIYTISLIAPAVGQDLLNNPEPRFLSESDFQLNALTRETGGRAFFPTALFELDGVYRAVADELSTQYALGYTPKTRPADGVFRRISVQVVGRPEVQLRTRTGYYAPRGVGTPSARGQ